MSKYFKLEEFLKSSTALKNKIDNSPSWKIVEHLKELATLLDDIREAWGKPIFINSGFRSPLLNKAVGGVATSGHLYGWTADIRTDGDLVEFAEFIYNFLTTNKIKYDELIFEKVKGSTWIHFAYKGLNGRQRMKHFNIER